MIRGIDISHHNSDDKGNKPIDWAKVAAITGPTDRIGFVILKISEGASYRDPTGEANAKGASEVDIPFGYYHFAELGTNSAVDEATNFFTAYKNIGIPTTYTYPFTLDFEQNKGLSPAACLAWVETFMQTFRSFFPAEIGGGLPESKILIYGAPDFLKENLPAGHTLGTRFPLWIATPDKAAPTLPPGWTDWAIWQYDWNASIAGITGAVDADWEK